jgi:hypothetical protein
MVELKLNIMTTYKIATILINYKEYANKYLGDCWASLEKIKLATDDWQIDHTIFIVDNQSDEDTYQTLQTMAPTARLIRNATNDGFAKGNNDAIAMAMAEGCDFVWVLNMDTIIEPDSLVELLKLMINNQKIGAAQSLLRLWPDQALVNSLGNSTHFLGYGYCLGYRQPMSQLNLDELNNQPIAYPSGASVLFRLTALRQVGLFDETFWMYNEDQDLGWRLWLAGWDCRLSAYSQIYHKYEFSRSSGKYYWLDRNRLLSSWKNYHWLTIIVLLPALLISDLVLAFVFWRAGRLKHKLKAWWYFINPLNWLKLIKTRHQSQRLRRVTDRSIIKTFSGRILFQEVDSPIVRVGNWFLNLYWQVIKLIIVW